MLNHSLFYLNTLSQRGKNGAKYLSNDGQNAGVFPFKVLIKYNFWVRWFEHKIYLFSRTYKCQLSWVHVAKIPSFNLFVYEILNIFIIYCPLGLLFFFSMPMNCGVQTMLFLLKTIIYEAPITYCLMQRDFIQQD